MKKNRIVKALFSTIAMPNIDELDLSGLKDVILSEKPDFFPPAIGWWFVFAFLFFILVFIFCYVKKKYFPSPYAYAMNELKHLKEQNLLPVKVGVNISKLLKRVAIFKFGREEVSVLTDNDWSLFLLEKGRHIFSKEETDFIAKSAWMPPKKDIAIDLRCLYTHTKEWIKYILKKDQK